MNTIDVMTGEIKYAKRHNILVSHAIGSCIVISIYDPKKQCGAMAHIMLPGRAPASKSKDKFKYAQDAIDEIMGAMSGRSGKTDHLQVCLVGGGNVLKKKDDSICRDNINSVKNTLELKKIAIKAESLGGEERRTMKLIIENGTVLFSKGNLAEKILYDPDTDKGKEI